MRNFWILTLDNFKSSLRTKRVLIFLVLYFLVFAVITHVFFEYQQQFGTRMAQQGITPLQLELLSIFAEGILGNGQETNAVLQFIFRVPPVNMLLFFVSLIGTPLLIFITNYDKISQEIYDGTVRYLLYRASRFQIFFAKFFSSMLECSVITLLATVLGVLWASMRFQSVIFSTGIEYGVRYWFIAQFFLAVFVALTLMASALFKKPFTALVFVFCAYVAMPIIAYYIPYISPFDSNYFEGLFFNTSQRLVLSLGAYTVFTTLFLSIGYSIFNRKDL
ncbi:MAG: ABC transporter permease subunit [Candidatus Harrisonbacteria bacterium]|nr:ABC transporter permease subunit [Candidatus Harrisonbacteria bacterium]